MRPLTEVNEVVLCLRARDLIPLFVFKVVSKRSHAKLVCTQEFIKNFVCAVATLCSLALDLVYIRKNSLPLINNWF